MLEKFGCIKRKRTKFILSLFSGIFYILGQGVLIGSSGISVYILSYIHHKDKWVDMQYGNLMMPVMTLFLSLFSPLSGPLEKACGPIISLIISSIIIEICFFLYYLQRNIWVFYSITLLTGLGAGLSANIPVKNACFYYPEKKGLISSVIMSFVGVSASVYILMGEKLINPEKEGVIDEKTEPYYSEKVSERIKYYFFFAMIVIPIGTLLSIFLFYKYHPDCEKEENEDNENNEENGENEENKENGEKEELKDVLVNKKKIKLNSFYKPSPSKNIKIALKKFRFWRNILITGITPFYFYFLQSSFRAYVVMLGVDTNIIFFLGSGIALISCLFGPIWAILVDKFGYQPIMKIIGFCCSGMSIFFYFFIDDKLFYVIGLIIAISTLIGIMSAATPHLMNIYGMRYFLTIGGFAKLFNEFSVFTAALTSIILSIFFKNAEELKFPYQIVIIVGGVLSIIGLILVFYENDEKFLYGDENEVDPFANKDGENPNDTFEKEKNYINENVSTILDASNSNRNTLNPEENKNEENVDNNEK